MKTTVKRILRKTIPLAFLAISYTGCEKNEPQEINHPDTLENATEQTFATQELAYPDRIGAVKEISFDGQKVQVEEIDGEFIFEGDIILDHRTHDHKGQKGVGRSLQQYRWPNNTVYYSIDTNLPNKARITDAIAHWENKTSLRFIQRTNQADYIRFKVGSGCSSRVGRIGGVQNINLAGGCSTGNTIHEIGHAIGLWHEQSRADRDQYITINFNNIQSGKSHNFQTYTQRGTDGKEYTSTLDFGSIMLYSSFAFSKNGQPTITKKSGSTYSVQRNALSAADIAGINLMYPPIVRVEPWINNYAYDSGGWRVDKHERRVGDVNGDGKADIIGFGSNHTYVSLSTGTSFAPPKIWISNYAQNAGGWRVDKHVRRVADVNGDGKDDIIGFGNDYTYVSLSTGSSFAAPKKWIKSFAYNSGGWRVNKHERTVADVNGDGKADIIGFGNKYTYVSLSTGSSFAAPKTWISNYAYDSGGWRVNKHVRRVADVNGDGKADVIGFGGNYTYVSLSTGSSFGTPKRWVTNYAYNSGGWRVDKHERAVADVNGDGKADVIGFGQTYTYVSLSTGSGFSTPQRWIKNYAYNSGSWRVNKNVRRAGDVNGDGKADVVGFANKSVFISRSDL